MSKCNSCGVHGYCYTGDCRTTWDLVNSICDHCGTAGNCNCAEEIEEEMWLEKLERMTNDERIWLDVMSKLARSRRDYHHMMNQQPTLRV